MSSSERLDVLLRCALGAGAVAIAATLAGSRAPRDAAVTPVPPAASTASLQAKAGADEAEEVFVRLTEKVGDAQIEIANLQRGLTEIALHWRRMQAPWKDTSKQSRARLVQLIALRTSQTEVAHVVTTKTGGTATFDAKKWNMSEGSFAQREAIVAPTPSTIRFRVRVPPQAALEIAPAVLGIGEGAATGPAGDVSFVARAIPVGGGAPVEIGRIVVQERDRWNEKRFDLSALAGKEIDLELLADAAIRKDFPNGTGLPPPMVLALWGTPRIVRKAPVHVPYNVLWIVVDSLRPDVIPSFHNPAVDEKKKAAKIAPRDTLLPVIEGLTPNLDALAKRSTIYRDAISAAPWTRPGTIAMLSGLHSRQLGVSPLPWLVPADQLDAYYASDAPLVPLAFRRAGVATRAFVNNNFMLGYAAVGLDMGFEHVEDYRYRTRDTAEVTRTAIDGLRAHAGERFFQFVNYNSPHEPFEPPPECLARVPGAVPAKAKKKSAESDPDEEKKPQALDAVKAYMAEACKDDAAVGELLATLDALHLREKTIVVVTADHGETLSDRHEGIAEELDQVNTRFHHAFGMWEETTRIPILLSLPGVIPEGKAVDGRVTNLDLAPTLLKLEGLDIDPRQKGIDLVAAAKTGVPERPIVTLGRASSAIFWKNWRFVLRDREAQKWTVGRGDDKETLTIHHELYDLDADPGESKNLGGLAANAALVEEMAARLKAAIAGAATADAPAEIETGKPPRIELRFVGAGGAHRVLATIKAPGATSIVATPIGLASEAVRTAGGVVELAATTAKDGTLGIDLIVIPATTPITWSFSWDDKPLGDEGFFGGVLGVTSPGLAKGLPDALLRAAVAAKAMPWIDSEIDRGVFVIRAGGTEGIERASAGAAAEEVKSALRQWGYAK
ncbi:MAG: sulfatase [Polyangiales bacterium]